jgi:hypothetical protein
VKNQKIPELIVDESAAQKSQIIFEILSEIFQFFQFQEPFPKRNAHKECQENIS